MLASVLGPFDWSFGNRPDYRQAAAWIAEAYRRGKENGRRQLQLEQRRAGR